MGTWIITSGHRAHRAHKVLPWVLSGISGIGMIGTAVAAAAATPRALEMKQEAEEAKGEELTLWEKVKAMAPSYLGAFGIGAATLASITANQLLNDSDKEALIGDILVGQQIHRQYKQRVKEKAPEAAEEIEKDMAREEWLRQVSEKIEGSEQKECSWVFMKREQYSEPMLFYLKYGDDRKDERGRAGVYFESTPGAILAAFYEANYQLQSCWGKGVVSVNDILDYLDRPQDKTEFGDRTTWDVGWMMEEYECAWIDLAPPTMVELETNVPNPLTCTILDFSITPMDEDYESSMYMSNS